MEKGTVIIGIDPDNNESGVGAVYDDKKFLAYKMNFPALIDYLKAMNESCRKKVKVVIEGGWLNKSNWHVLNKFMTAVKAAAIGRSTGMNHQTGILIVECCKHYNIPYEIIKPLKKCWKGKDGKITQDEIAYFMSSDGKMPRMNQDQRDALLLAWVCAGYKVKVKPKKPQTTLQKTIRAFDG